MKYKKLKSLLFALLILNSYSAAEEISLSYTVVDTGVSRFYSDTDILEEPNPGEPFWGQDGQFIINSPSYTDNGDGTVSDNVTGLVWMKEMGEKLTFDEAFDYAENLELAGYSDWRVPTIKELYSLILFTGRVKGEKAIDFFIDTDYFIQPLGESSKGEREIDAQTWSSTEYVGKTMGRDDTIFGVNFVDGRIKGYPKFDPRTKDEKKMYFRLVRGNSEYGKNDFIDNGNYTVTDAATGLMWQKADSLEGMDWEDALKYAEDLELAGYDDWRLPNAKELQTLVDYTRSPQTSHSAAIDPVFEISEITDPDGDKNYPYFWTGTTHLDGMNPYASAAYIAFGEALGKMRNKLMDVHGAGAQRSDPKSGRKSQYPEFFGPQGDVRYVFNFVRCVRTSEF
jgi:hypothetical protein